MITESSDLLHHVDIEYEDIGDRDLFEQYFKCPVNYGADRNALVFQPQAGDLPSRFSSPVHHHLAKELADRELAALSGHRNLSERVIKELTPLLTSEPPTIDELAEKMGMTSWTLRRRLKKENTSFQELLDNTRKDLAICYVADTIHSFSEITYILGFSSTSAFYKAFKRWTGENPGDYRKSEDHSRDR